MTLPKIYKTNFHFIKGFGIYVSKEWAKREKNAGDQHTKKRKEYEGYLKSDVAAVLAVKAFESPLLWFMCVTRMNRV